jgi:hypothetical protein
VVIYTVLSDRRLLPGGKALLDQISTLAAPIGNVIAVHSSACWVVGGDLKLKLALSIGSYGTIVSRLSRQHSDPEITHRHSVTSYSHAA